MRPRRDILDDARNYGPGLLLLLETLLDIRDALAQMRRKD